MRFERRDTVDEKVEVSIQINQGRDLSKSISESVDDLKELIQQLNRIQKECNCHCTLSVSI